MIWVEVAARSRSTPAPTVTCPSRRTKLVQLTRGQPSEAAEVSPLVFMRLQGRPIQKNRRAAAPRSSLQRCCDQVPLPAQLQDVLGGEQPVVAGQAHPAAQRDRLAEQPTSGLACQRGGDGEVKNSQACAPVPERDSSKATGAPTARAALR